MASSSIAQARKRSAQIAARRVPKRTSVDVAVSDHVAKARDNFTYFCCAMGKPPAPHMLEWHRELVTSESNYHLLDVSGPNTCLLSPRGPLDLATPVLTPDGWRPLGQIRKGAIVFTSAGRETRVVSTVNYGKAECWEVVFSDGTSVVCDDSHRWRVCRTAGSQRWQIKTLQELRVITGRSF